MITLWRADDESIRARERDLKLLALYRTHTDRDETRPATAPMKSPNKINFIKQLKPDLRSRVTNNNNNTKKKTSGGSGGKVKHKDSDGESSETDDEDGENFERSDDRMLDESEGIEHAGAILYQIIKKVQEDVSQMPSFTLAVAVRYFLHVAGASIVALFYFFSSTLQRVQNLDFFKKLLTGKDQTNNDNLGNSYLTYMLPRAQYTSNPELTYIVGLVLIFVSSLLSTISFEVYLNRSCYKPFLKSYLSMKYLLCTSSVLESNHHKLPYCQLSRKRKLVCFSKISDYLRIHDQGSQMGQALTGFAAMLLVDVVIIAGFVSLFLLKNISLRVISILVFYILFCSYWCFKILFKAVQINQIHLQTLTRLTEYQKNIALITDDGIDQGEVFDMLERVRSSMEASFKPVRVFGIPATPTLLNVFIGYLGTSVLALVTTYIFGGA